VDAKSAQKNPKVDGLQNIFYKIVYRECTKKLFLVESDQWPPTASDSCFPTWFYFIHHLVAFSEDDILLFVPTLLNIFCFCPCLLSMKTGSVRKAEHCWLLHVA
jgi:hypothetical protein